MKNYLNFFYDIDSVDIHQDDNNYYFTSNEYKFKFFKYDGNLNHLKDIYDFSNNLLQHGIYCNQIIMNKNQNITTLIDGKNYVLLRYHKNLDKKINLNDILKFNYFSVPDNKFDCSDWKRLWELKIDYFSYQLNQFGYKHPLLRESFGYYSGYVELAISLLNTIQKNKDNLSLSHKRLKETSTLYDLYDPFNMILDDRVRDVTEYFKSKIFSDNLMQEITNYFSLAKLKNYEYNLFFIRMLYPSFYFDVFEEIMNNDLGDDEIKPILKNTKKYEIFIKNLYRYIMTISNIPVIDWLMH